MATLEERVATLEAQVDTLDGKVDDLEILAEGNETNIQEIIAALYAIHNISGTSLDPNND